VRVPLFFQLAFSFPDKGIFEVKKYGRRVLLWQLTFSGFPPFDAIAPSI